MANWYKPRYKIVYTLKSKVWPYQRSRLRGIVDKRGGVVFRKGFIHRQRRVLKSLKWMQVRRRFGLGISNFSWKLRKKNRFLNLHQQYKVKLQQKQGLLNIYGKLDQTQLKKLYKNYFIKSKTYKLLALLRALEMRSHVVLYRLKIFPTIFSAHQYISHHGILVNGVLTKQPSKILNAGDIISIPQQYWTIMTFLLYNKIHNRMHREALNWARRWYKLYWYNRLLKINVLDFPEIYKSDSVFKNVMSTKIWKNKNISLIDDNNVNYIHLSKNRFFTYFFKNKGHLRWLFKSNFDKKQFQKQMKTVLKVSGYKQRDVKKIYSKLLYKFFLSKKELKYNNKNNKLFQDLLFNRLFSFYWLFTNFSVNNSKHNLKFYNKNKYSIFLQLKKNFYNKSENVFVNLNSNLILQQYFVKNLYLKHKQKGIRYNFKKDSLNLTKLRKIVYQLHLLKKFEKVFLRLYVWMLKYSKKISLHFLTKFLTVYKIWMQPLNKIYGLIFKIQKLNQILMQFTVLVNKQIFLNNKENIKLYLYYILLFQYKIKEQFQYLINELNNLKYNKVYFKLIVKLLKNFTLLEYTFNTSRYYHKTQNLILSQYLDLLNDKHFKNVAELNKFCFELIKKIEKELLLTPDFNNIAYNDIYSKNDIIKLLQTYSYQLELKGYSLDDISNKVKEVLFKLFSKKLEQNKSFELFRNSFFNTLDNLQQQNDGLINLTQKWIFSNFKDKNLVQLKNVLEINKASGISLQKDTINQKRQNLLKKYFLFYHTLFKNRSKNQWKNFHLKKMKRDQSFFSNKKLVSKVKTSINSRKYNSLKDGNTNDMDLKKFWHLSKSSSFKIRPRNFKKLNYMLNIYKRLKFLNIYNLMLSEDHNFYRISNQRVWRNRKFLSLKISDMLIKNYVQRLIRLRLLLKKQLLKHKRYKNKMQFFLIQPHWYIPSHIEVDWLTNRFIILHDPYSSDVVNSLNSSNLYKSVLNFLARRGY